MNKVAPRGMDRAFLSKVAAKYDLEKAKEIRDWIKELLGEDIGIQQQQVEKNLSDGTILLRLVAEVFKRIPDLPEKASKADLKIGNSNNHIRRMDNISRFLTAAKLIGVPDDSCFNTSDLYDGKNLPMVLSTILVFGSEAQRYNMSGPVCGPKPQKTDRKHFTLEQLRAGEGIIGGQSGTNKLASQKGMTMGKQRMLNDAKVDLTMTKEGEAILSSQSGYNKGASQKGMRSGPRKPADMKFDTVSKESEGFLGLQAGFVEGANQSGLSFGAPRLISDPKKTQTQMSAESHSLLSLQTGTNLGASQAGMAFANPRQIAGSGSGEEFQGKSEISTQYGYTKGATQAGMNIGKTRKITKN